MNAMEEPHPSALLAAARAALLEQVVPALEGGPKFQALMVANAIAIAQRGLEAGAVTPLDDEAGLSAAIRAGRHDNDAAMAQLLRDYTDARCRISVKPARSL